MKLRLLALATSAALLLVMAAALPDATARGAGCLGYVSQTPLNRLTETPPPGSALPPSSPVRDFDLGPPGWHNFVWTGPSATDPGAVLECIADDYAIAYRLQSDQTYQRYVPGRTDLSTMATVDKYDSLLVLSTDSGARCVGMPIDP